MADLISKVMTEVQARLPDATTARLIILVNRIHRGILAEIPECRKDSLVILLIAGQQEYAITETVFQVDYSTYISAAGAGFGNKLFETNVEALNETSPTWRTDATGVPQQVYLSSAQIAAVNTETIGFVPAPNLTSVAGFPNVTLYGSFLQAADLLSTDTTLVNLPNSQVYIEGVSFLAATEIRPQIAGAFKSEYEYQLQLAKKFVRTRLEGLQDYPRRNVRGGGYQSEVRKA